MVHKYHGILLNNNKKKEWPIDTCNLTKSPGHYAECKKANIKKSDAI